MDIATLVDIKKNPKIPTLAPGDTVKVHVKVVEGERERIQIFQGVVIKVRRGATGSFTVRRVAYGIGVERSFPMNSPLVDKVEVTRHGKVRRAKLFYLRGLTAKKARIKEKRELLKPEAGALEAEAAAPEAATPEAAAPEAVQPEATKPEAITPETPKAAPEPPKPEAEVKPQ